MSAAYSYSAVTWDCLTMNLQIFVLLYSTNAIGLSEMILAGICLTESLLWTSLAVNVYLLPFFARFVALFAQQRLVRMLAAKTFCSVPILLCWPLHSANWEDCVIGSSIKKFATRKNIHALTGHDMIAWQLDRLARHTKHLDCSHPECHTHQRLLMVFICFYATVTDVCDG